MKSYFLEDIIEKIRDQRLEEYLYKIYAHKSSIQKNVYITLPTQYEEESQ